MWAKAPAALGAMIQPLALAKQDPQIGGWSLFLCIYVGTIDGAMQRRPG